MSLKRCSAEPSQVVPLGSLRLPRRCLAEADWAYFSGARPSRSCCHVRSRPSRRRSTCRPSATWRRPGPAPSCVLLGPRRLLRLCRRPGFPDRRPCPARRRAWCAALRGIGNLREETQAAVHAIVLGWVRLDSELVCCKPELHLEPGGDSVGASRSWCWLRSSFFGLS